MNKKSILVLAGLAMISTATTTFAGHKSAAKQQQSSAKGQHGGAAQRIETALDQLDLSATQKDQVHTILSDAKAKLQTLKGTAKGTDAKVERKQITQKARQDVMAVLDATQKAKLKEILKEERGQKKA